MSRVVEIYKLLFVMIFQRKEMAFLFLDNHQIIRKIIKEKKSLIRWGDGESKIVSGKSIKFQKHSLELETKLRIIIEDYSDNSHYLLGLPKKGLNTTVSNLFKIPEKSKLIHRSIFTWYKSRYLFRKMRNKQFFDAFFFRDKIIRKIDFNQIIQNKNIIYVSSQKKQIQNLKKITSKSYFIEIDEVDCFDSIGLIAQKISKMISKENISKKDTIILVSAGPAAKVFIYEMSKKGYQLIDIGSFDFIFRN